MAQRPDGTVEQKRPGGTTPMPNVCPHCGSKEIDSGGKCQVCGHRASEEKHSPDPQIEAERSGTEGSIKVEFSTSPEEQSTEIPEWRHELSRRLLEIKLKRGEVAPPDLQPPAKTVPFPHAEQTSPASAPPVVDAPLRHESAQRPSAPAAGVQDRIVRLPERSGTRQQRVAKKADGTLPLFQPARRKAGTRSTPAEADLKPLPKITDPDPAALKSLLDSIVLRQAEPAVVPPRTADSGENAASQATDKLILLSRALSGFVDLSIVTLLTGGIILSADFFSGIEMIDNVSKIWYAMLLLATYLLYSTFFLGTANQTIGMMIKDLRVVGEDGGRPGMRQILLLGTTYLPSVAAAGVGLVWACFDRKSRCLHDRLSRTRVVRL